MRLSFIILLLFPFLTMAQYISIDLNKNWKFCKEGDTKWYNATVPGTIHTDLLDNKLITNPFFRNNENKLQWISEANWIYKTIFNVNDEIITKKNISLQFDGLDTYADVYLNNQLILQADNMFRQWIADVKSIIRKGKNELTIQFYSAQNKVNAIAKSKLPFVLPDHPRVYARKAQYHFGWDWAPKLVTCGIWKKISLNAENSPCITIQAPIRKNPVQLIQRKDSIGTTFYFEKNGTPIYIKGANYIPSDVFLTRVKKEDYRRIIKAAKDANMNMLRVWGGGVYEADEFYELCEEYGIMVWQDFMFAGGMIPGDEHFFNNVREEVKYQVNRLRHHACIVLWCGNNEIDEAWHNWDWQNQFNLHGQDSAKVWNDYKRLFHDSLPKWINEYDGSRPYITTSPLHGWGREKSLTEGDSHYWGVWWGMQLFEIFETKTGRFVSEYGMQAMPNLPTIESVTLPEDRFLYSPVLRMHQKHPTGFQNIKGYLHQYFLDSSKVDKLSLEDYIYLTQCLQYFALKNIIAIHRSKYPVNMGTLLWQLNDCWPVASWSITDYSREPKAAWYAVKEAYREDKAPQKDSIYPKKLKLPEPRFIITKENADILSVQTNVPAKYVFLTFPGYQFGDNYFDLLPGEKKCVSVTGKNFSDISAKNIKIKSLYNILSQ